MLFCLLTTYKYVCSMFSSPIPLLFLCRKFVTRRWETCSTCCSSCRHLCPWTRPRILSSSRSELQREERKVIDVLLLFVDCVYSSVSSSVLQTIPFDGFTFNVYICHVPYLFAGNSEHKDLKEEPFDPHAAAWLLDEALWSADNAPPTAATSNKNDNLFVNPSVVQMAAEQHVHALHALRTSGITHSNKTSTTTDTTSTKKHWGAVALPLPLHIVTNPVNTASATNSEAPIDGTVLRGSGEWKDVRNSFNRSFDADTANNTAANAATTSSVNTKGSANANATATGSAAAYSSTTPSSLSQRLLTDAKLFRPLATQWAAGIFFECISNIVLCMCIDMHLLFRSS